MAIRKLPGYMLQDNLVRPNDLSIETSFIYFDVTNNRLGINTITPATALDIAGTLTATNMTITGGLDLGGASITNLADPVAGTDGVNLQTLNAAIASTYSSIVSNNSNVTVVDDNISAGLINFTIDGTLRLKLDASTAEFFGIPLSSDGLLSTGSIDVTGGSGIGISTNDGVFGVGPDMMPTMTADTDQGITLIATGSSTNPPAGQYVLFDDITANQYDFGNTTILGLPIILEIQGVNDQITQINIMPSTTIYAPTQFSFEGWDGVSWTQLTSQFTPTGWTDGVFRNFSFTNNQTYSNYRLVVNAHTTGGNLILREIELLPATAATTTFNVDSLTGDTVLAGDLNIGNMAAPGKLYSAVGGGPDYNLEVGVNRNNENITIRQVWAEYQASASAASMAIKARGVNDIGTPGTILFVDGVNQRVGVGETIPTSKLHLKSTSSSLLKMQQTSVSNEIGFELAAGGIGLYDYTNTVYQQWWNGLHSGVGNTTNPSSNGVFSYSSSDSVFQIYSASQPAYLVLSGNIDARIDLIDRTGSVDLKTSRIYNSLNYLRFAKVNDTGLTTTDIVKLDMNNHILEVHHSDTTNGPRIRLNNTNSTILDTNLLGTIDWRVNDGSFLAARIFAKARGNFDGLGSSGGQLVFNTSLDNGTENTNAFVIDYNGQVGVGIATPDSVLHVYDSASAAANTSPGITLERAGSTYFTFKTTNWATAGLRMNDPEGEGVGSVLYNHSTDSMSITTNSVEAIHVDSSQKIGFGTGSPDTKLHIYEGLSGGAVNTNPGLTLESDGSNFITFLTPSTAAPGISWSDPTTIGIAAIRFDHNTDKLRYLYNSVDYFVIDMNSNVSIGSGTADSRLHVFEGASGAAANTKGGITVESNIDSYVTFQNPSANEGGLLWSNALTANEGRLIYNHSGKYMTMFVDSTEVMKLTNGTNRAEIFDNGSASSVLLRLSNQDQNLYNLVLGNGNYSATNTDGLAFFVSDGGLSVMDGRGTGATMRLAINGISAIDIDSSQKVGIGTGSPDSRLHVYEGSSGGAANIQPGITLENSGHAYLTFKTPDANAGGLLWSDATSANVAQIIYNHSTNIMEFYTNSTKAVSINSSQNVAIGINTPLAKTHIANGLSGIPSISSNGNILVLESGSTNGVTIATPDASTGILMFGSTTSNRGAEISWGYSASEMKVGTRKVGGSLVFMADNAIEAGRFDSAGGFSIKGNITTNKTSAAVLDYTSNIARLRAYGSTAGTGELSLRTGGGGGSVDAEAVRITSGGNVGIGLAQPGQNLTGNAAYDLTGKILHVNTSSGESHLVLEGLKANITLVDDSSSANNKAYRFQAASDKLELRRMNDDGTVGTILETWPSTAMATQSLDDIIDNTTDLPVFVAVGIGSTTAVCNTRGPNAVTSTAYTVTDTYRVDDVVHGMYPNRQYVLDATFNVGGKTGIGTPVISAVNDAVANFRVVLYSTGNTWYGGGVQSTTSPANIDVNAVFKFRFINNNFVIYGLDTNGYPTLWVSGDAGANFTQYTVVSSAAANAKMFCDVVWSGTKYVLNFYDSTLTTSYVYNSSNLTTWTSVSTITISTGLRHTGLVSNGSGEVLCFTAFDDNYTSSPLTPQLYYSTNNGDSWTTKDTVVWGHYQNNTKIDSLYCPLDDRYYVGYSSYKQLARIKPSSYFTKSFRINGTPPYNTTSWTGGTGVPYEHAYFDMTFSARPTGTSGDALLWIEDFAIILPYYNGTSTVLYEGCVPMQIGNKLSTAFPYYW